MPTAAEIMKFYVVPMFFINSVLMFLDSIVCVLEKDHADKVLFRASVATFALTIAGILGMALRCLFA